MREKAEKTAKRKLTRAERKQIEAVIRQAKGDGKAHTVQDSIPFQNMFPDGLCRLEGGTFSKTIAFEDVNYRLAGPEDQRSIFESLCDFYNGYDPSIGVQVTFAKTSKRRRRRFPPSRSAFGNWRRSSPRKKTWRSSAWSRRCAWTTRS